MPRHEASHGPGASVAPGEGVAHVGAALDYVTDAVILLEHDWTIQFVNVAFERASGRQREALIGRNYWTCLGEAMGSRFDIEARASTSSTSTTIPSG